jgi:hypothetical protein
MNKGFFVIINENHRVFKKPDEGRRWTAKPFHPLKGWLSTSGENIEEVLHSQKKQYVDRYDMGKPVPVAIEQDDGPIASGEMVRFISI